VPYGLLSTKPFMLHFYSVSLLETSYDRKRVTTFGSWSWVIISARYEHFPRDRHNTNTTPKTCRALRYSFLSPVITLHFVPPYSRFSLRSERTTVKASFTRLSGHISLLPYVREDSLRNSVALLTDVLTTCCIVFTLLAVFFLHRYNRGFDCDR
jgi:hypothetical protein